VEVRKFDSQTGHGEADTRAKADFLFEGLELFDELVYFGHGYVDQFAHERAGLTLSIDPQEKCTFLPCNAIANFDLSRMTLAVVMACGAGQGNVFVESAPSMAGAFSMAGVQSVVAPLWPIGRKVGSSYVTEFVKQLDRSASSGSARAIWNTVLEKDPNGFFSVGLFE
jgi:CHAT domain-containing protein